MITTINCEDYIDNGLTIFGKEVNSNRQLASIKDGLKPVYRRVISTSLKTEGKFTKTAAITGNTLSTLHPHGSDSVDAVIASLVNWGIFNGQGSFGMRMIYGDDIPAAAPRYTEAKIDPKWSKLIKYLMPYVPYKEAELEGNVEPEYLPTPIPMILLFSGMGLGFGVNARYPMFTANSIYEAYINNDSSLLEAPFGLELDKVQSDLNDLWERGVGRVCYKYHCENTSIASGGGTMISGSAEIFKPTINGEFKRELEAGQVYVIDQTSGDIPQIFIGRSPNVRGISYDEIYDRCVKICQCKRYFRLTVTDGETAFVIPMRDWIKYTYDNYLKLVETYKSDQIDKLEFDYKVYDWLQVVAQCQIDHRDWEVEQISDETKCDLEVAKAILRKSIGTLRNTDSKSKLKDITNKIKEFKQIDPKKFVADVIKEF